MRSARILLPALLALVPTSAATLGTEELPELSDEGGDVGYHMLHAGPRESHHLDILAAWFWHEPSTDHLHFTFKVMDATRYHAPPTDYRYECTFRAVTESPGGEGALFFSLFNSVGRPMESLVAFDEDAPHHYDGTSKRFPHRLTIRQDTHGYIDYGVERQRVLQEAEVLRDLRADCYEDYQPGPSTLYTNGDVSSSKGSYSVVELRRERRPDGQLDPVEQFERTHAPSPESTEPEMEAPGIDGLVAALACGSSVALRRRRRQP